MVRELHRAVRERCLPGESICTARPEMFEQRLVVPGPFRGRGSGPQPRLDCCRALIIAIAVVEPMHRPQSLPNR
jgi:hypothetical protein